MGLTSPCRMCDRAWAGRPWCPECLQQWVGGDISHQEERLREDASSWNYTASHHMSALTHCHQTHSHSFRAKAVGTPTGVAVLGPPDWSTVTPGGDTPQSQSRPAQSLVPGRPGMQLHPVCSRGYWAEPPRLHPVPARPRHSQLSSALTVMLSPFLPLEKLFYQFERITEERGNGLCFPARFLSVRGKLTLSEGLWREAGSKSLHLSHRP